jgi:hypothetical protein
MKNTDCVIYITTKRGYTQTYLKDNNGWTQTSPNGIVRRMTAEQLLSHLLPPLITGNNGHLIVRVERRNKTKEYAEMAVRDLRKEQKIMNNSNTKIQKESI